jgi:CubicO group peptidase (beta-lactamase class C family)
MDDIWTKYQSQLVGMCLGAVDDDVAVTKCFGKKAPGATVAPNQRTLFRIESVSKTFAATLLAARLQEGKVTLDEKVRTLVPLVAGKTMYPPSLTLRDLAQHYSGLPKPTPKAANVDVFLTKTGTCLASSSCRVAAPGATFLYSNWGVSVLGNLLAVHDGFVDGSVTPWDRDSEQTITGPLGMKDTRSFQGWVVADPIGFASRRALSGTPGTPNPYSAPGGGLYSSAHDMLLWLRYSMGLHGTTFLLEANHWLYRDTPLRPTKSAGRSVGLVWDVMAGSGAGGVECISKAGDGAGFHAQLHFVEGKKRGVFLLVNDTPTTSYRTIADELLNTLPPTPGAGSVQCPPGQG